MTDFKSASKENPNPMAPYRAMFNAEVEQATTELQRPAQALFASGTVAGVSVAIVILLLGAVLAQEQIAPSAGFRLSLGAIYAVGFTLAIMARTDLFTEYTTISVFPLLTGDSTFGAVARLWALVYSGNLFGAFIVAILSVFVGPELQILMPEDMASFGRHLAGYAWWAILLSGVAAGWLMGLLSWLLAGGRDTTSQILFIWVIGGLIGFLGLHHAITGGGRDDGCGARKRGDWGEQCLPCACLDNSRKHVGRNNVRSRDSAGRAYGGAEARRRRAQPRAREP